MSGPREAGSSPVTAMDACAGWQISVDGAWLSQARAILRTGQGSPDAERPALGEVVRSYTAYLAASFGGKPDGPGSPPQMSGVYGQMDCLDETANTTSLLLVLQDQGLLTHHVVEYPESRGFFLDGRYPHFTAVIAEKRTGSGMGRGSVGEGPGSEAGYPAAHEVAAGFIKSPEHRFRGN